MEAVIHLDNMGRIVWESVLEKRIGADAVRRLLDIVADNCDGEDSIDWRGAERDLVAIALGTEGRTV